MVMKASFTRKKDESPVLPKGVKKVVVVDEPDTQVIGLKKEVPVVAVKKEGKRVRYTAADGKYGWRTE